MVILSKNETRCCENVRIFYLYLKKKLPQNALFFVLQRLAPKRSCKNALYDVFTTICCFTDLCDFFIACYGDIYDV